MITNIDYDFVGWVVQHQGTTPAYCSCQFMG